MSSLCSVFIRAAVFLQVTTLDLEFVIADAEYVPADPFREQREARAERPFELLSAGGDIRLTLEPLNDCGPAVAILSPQPNAVEPSVPGKSVRKCVELCRVGAVIVAERA